MQELSTVTDSAIANLSDKSYKAIALDILRALVRLDDLEDDADLRRLCFSVHSKHLVMGVCRALQLHQVTAQWPEAKYLKQ